MKLIGILLVKAGSIFLLLLNALGILVNVTVCNNITGEAKNKTIENFEV